MRTFKKFLQDRACLCGIMTVQALARTSKVNRATVYEYFVDDVKQLPDGQFGTLFQLANALRFESWDDLMGAYGSDDVSVGIGSPGVKMNSVLTAKERGLLVEAVTPKQIAHVMAAAAERIRRTEADGR